MVKVELPESVCDVHVHIGFFPTLQVTMTLDQLYSVMDKYVIDSALVFSSWFSPDQDTEKILKALEKDRRLYALIRSNLRDYRSQRFLNRLEKLLKSNPQVVGMKFNSSTEKHRVTDPIYEGCLEVLNDCEAVLLIHCGRWVEMSGWHFGVQVARAYPHIKVILAHMGGTHPDLSLKAIEAAKNVRNVYMDTSQTRQTIVIKKGIETLGSSRILFGSDMPWGNYVQNLIVLQMLELSETVLNDVLRRNFNKIVKGE